MIYHFFPLKRDRQLRFQQYGYQTSIGYQAYSVEDFEYGIIDPMRTGKTFNPYHNDAYISLGNSISTVDAQKLNLPIIKTLEYIPVQQSTVFFERLFLNLNGTLIPYRLRYYNPYPVTLVHLENLAKIYAQLMNIPSADIQIEDPRLNTFLSTRGYHEWLMLFDEQADQLDRTLQSTYLGGRVAYDALSSSTVETHIRHMILRMIDGSIRLHRNAMLDTISRIVPLDCPPLLASMFRSGDSLTLQELYRTIIPQQIVDTHTPSHIDIFYRENTEFSPHSVQEFAEFLAGLDVCDITMMLRVEYPGAQVRLHDFRIINRYLPYRQVANWQMRFDVDVVTHCLMGAMTKFLSTHQRPLPQKMYFIKIVKTFNEEALIQFFETSDDLSRPFYQIHLDLAIMSLCSLGVTTGFCPTWQTQST